MPPVYFIKASASGFADPQKDKKEREARELIKPCAAHARPVMNEASQRGAVAA